LTNSKTLHSELELIDKSVFKICGLGLTNVEPEAESQEYFAHNFLLNGQNVKFRKAKITPTKIGQFVKLLSAMLILKFRWFVIAVSF